VTPGAVQRNQRPRYTRLTRAVDRALWRLATVRSKGGTTGVRRCRPEEAARSIPVSRLRTGTPSYMIEFASAYIFLSSISAAVWPLLAARLSHITAVELSLNTFASGCVSLYSIPSSISDYYHIWTYVL
jgi:hypothetical protein